MTVPAPSLPTARPACGADAGSDVGEGAALVGLDRAVADLGGPPGQDEAGEDGQGRQPGEAALQRLAVGTPPHGAADLADQADQDVGEGGDRQHHDHHRERAGERADEVAVAERDGHLVLLGAGARPGGADEPGQGQHHQHRDAEQDGHHGEHPGGDDRAGPGLERPGLRVRRAPRHEAAQGGADPLEEVGDAGQVGEHVVAVEAHERQQLAQHLQDLGRDQQQDGVVAGDPPDAHGDHRDDRVEVEAAEVGAQPAGPPEAVGVGDVGVERRPDEVEPGAHDAGRGAAAAGGGGVAELVEAGREDGDGEDGEQQARAGRRPRGSRRRGPCRTAPTSVIQPKASSTGTTTPMLNSAANGVVSRRVFSSSVTATLNRRPSSGLLRLSSGSEPSSRTARPIGRSLSTSSRTLSSDTGLPVACGHHGGHVGVRASSVERGQRGVEQRGELDGLPVGAPGQGRGRAVARALHLADERDPVGARRRDGAPGAGRAAGDRGRDRLGHGWGWSGCEMSEVWSALAVGRARRCSG